MGHQHAPDVRQLTRQEWSAAPLAPTHCLAQLLAQRLLSSSAQACSSQRDPYDGEAHELAAAKWDAKRAREDARAEAARVEARCASVL